MINVKNYILSDEAKKTKENNIKRIMSDRVIVEMIKSSNLNTEVIERNSQDFIEYLDNLEICNNCKGIMECKHSIRGFLPSLKFDHVLRTVLIPCEFNNNEKKAIKKNFLHRDYPDAWLEYDFNNLIIPNTNAYKNSLVKIVENIKKPDKGLYLYGDVGVGKTRLLVCIANYFAAKNKKIAFFNIASLTNLAKSYITSPNNITNLMNDLKKCDILLLDDIGASKVSEWIRDDWLNAILNYRLENKKLTYISSNLGYDGLRKYFTTVDGQDLDAVRLLERIEALTDPIQIVGKNWRREVV